MGAPAIAYASLGNSNLGVPVTTSIPFKTEWAGMNTVYNSPNQFTGSDGYNIVTLKGNVSNFTLQHTVFENYYNIISWIDEDHIESQIFGLEVNSIDHILEFDFDLVLIASIDQHYTNEAVNKLTQLGIKRDKIACFKLDLTEIEKAIIKIGFDINTFNYKDQIYGLNQ